MNVKDLRPKWGAFHRTASRDAGKVLDAEALAARGFPTYRASQFSFPYRTRDCPRACVHSEAWRLSA